MKKITLLWLLLLLPLAGAEECLREMTGDQIPCNIITTWRPGTCSNYDLLVYNSSGANIVNYTFGEYPPVCNATFKITKPGAYYYNSTIDTGVINVQEDDDMIFLLLIPLGLCFLFIYWAGSLNEDQEALKWFMRGLSLLMIFAVYAGADIIIAMNPSYAGLNAIFNITYIQWIFYTFVAVFLVYFIYKIFMAFKLKQKDDFEKGVIK